MATWSDYKNHVRMTNSEIWKDIDEIEALSQTVSAMIEKRHNLDLSQRNLANELHDKIKTCFITNSSLFVK